MSGLIRNIPARTETAEFNWCKKDFILRRLLLMMSSRREPPDKCWWCRSDFEEDEMLALASFKNKGVNRLICQKCAAEAGE